MHGLIRPEELLYRAASQNTDVLLPFRAADKLRASAEAVTPVDQRDAPAGACQKERVLKRDLAAAHDRNVQSLIKRAVADSAVGYAAAGKRSFRRKPQ